VDLAEHIAAKSALENARDVLAERLCEAGEINLFENIDS